MGMLAMTVAVGLVFIDRGIDATTHEERSRQRTARK
jgi:hypothetical protein